MRKLPIIFQAELSECGLVCLAMVFAYYGIDISLATLRNKNPLSNRGVTLYQIRKIAQDYGLKANVLRLDISQLSTVRLPCIIHWRFNHFLVLNTIQETQFLIHDPAQGVRTVDIETFSSGFTGVVLELIDDLPGRRPLKRFTFPIISPSVNKYLFNLMSLLVISIVIQCLYLFSVYFTQSSIDVAISNSSAHWIPYVCFGLLGSKLMQLGLASTRAYFITIMGSTINLEIGQKLSRYLIQLPISYFESRHSSDILNRFTSIDKIRLLLSEGLVDGVVDGVVSIVLFIAILYINPFLGFILITGYVLFAISRILFYQQFRQQHETGLYLYSRVMNYLMETLKAITTVKLFTNEQIRLEEWRNRYIDVLNNNTLIAWHRHFYEFFKNAIFEIEFVVLLFFGVVMLMKHQLSVGSLYSVLSFRQQLQNSLIGLSNRYQDYQLIKLYREHLQDLTLSPREDCYNYEKCEQHNQASYRLAIDSVSFRYGEYDKYLFKDFSLNIREGECIALVGPSGCGKSTLFKILLGLLPPNAGNVYWDNLPIYPSHVMCYRQRVSAVMQNDCLFSGTIIENITFQHKQIDLNRINFAARHAGILDEINQFPLRFNTLIGESGCVLSGGQRQRLLLARALYANPRVLFLDEATSHLDIDKEREVNAFIRSLGVTVVMIAHRPETIAMADRVVRVG